MGFPSVDADNRLVYIVAKNARLARSRASRRLLRL
jgi:hypothetical protein